MKSLSDVSRIDCTNRSAQKLVPFLDTRYRGRKKGRCSRRMVKRLRIDRGMRLSGKGRACRWRDAGGMQASGRTGDDDPCRQRGRTDFRSELIECGAGWKVLKRSPSTSFSNVDTAGVPISSAGSCTGWPAILSRYRPDPSRALQESLFSPPFARVRCHQRGKSYGGRDRQDSRC